MRDEDLRPATATPAPAPRDFTRAALVVSVGLLVTGLGWPGTIGRLPLGLLLKNQFNASPQQVSGFWAIATLPWYVKPLFGLLSDCFPIARTRRQGYLIIGAALAATCWATLAIVPRAYAPFLLTLIVLNVGLVVVSTAIGAIIVEEGQRQRATGRLSALRSALEGVMAIVSGRLGGWLAGVAFAYTSLTGAAIVLTMVPVAWLFFREPVRAQPTRTPWLRARAQLKTCLSSRSVWMVAGLVFLVFLSPGLQTPLMYYQQDVLKFEPGFMGTLQTVGGVCAFAGALTYAWLCRRVPLRWSLIGGIVLSALTTLLYLNYASAKSALWIEGATGFFGAIALLPLYDLTARATPEGSESFGYALVLSVRTIALFAISDPLGSLLYGRFHLPLSQLIWINAGFTLLVLAFVPFLPALLLAAREEGSGVA